MYGATHFGLCVRSFCLQPSAVTASMDPASVFDATPASSGEPSTSSATATKPPHLKDRRREKPQLSCNFCRRRKVRCDRKLPCRTCIGKGIELSCTYTPDPQNKNTSSVGDRIKELETLVRSLLQEQQEQQRQLQTAEAVTGFLGGTFRTSTTHSSGGVPYESARYVSEDPVGVTPSTFGDAGRVPVATSLSRVTSLNIEHYNTSTSSFEHGSPKVSPPGAKYRSNIHWTAVLDSISDLKDHYEMEEEERVHAAIESAPGYNFGPRLLYETVHATKAEIIASIPDRPIVDGIVAKYFQAQALGLAIIHSGKFLREYEKFWQEPDAASYSWIGLLFSTMCVATQYHRLTDTDSDELDYLARVHTFRERTVQCLVLCQFTKGGVHVMETLVNYCSCELMLCNDADIGPWLLVGMIVQLALSHGYHRDPQNFPSVSPFAGEMRRRVWATIVQMDLRISSQLGHQRRLKCQQCDTAEPRNLLDTDFDVNMVELPPSRPEAEITPVLFCIAKIRFDSVSGPISDLVADALEPPYAEITKLDRRLRNLEATLPPAFQWRPLSQLLMVPPHIILWRIWIQLALNRLTIWLHRRYLSPAHTEERYEPSHRACVQAAIGIVEFQLLIEEETQPDGQLQPFRSMPTPLVQGYFLQAMSVLCYYVQLIKATPKLSLDRDTSSKIHDLLHKTYPIWLRSSIVSRDAEQAVEHLGLCLGLRSPQGGLSPSQNEIAAPYTTPGNPVGSLYHPPWDMTCHAYQEYFLDFPMALGIDFMALDGSVPPSLTSISLTDLQLGHTSGLDE
ncbi:fungal-specific transcription factor domain-containing protein [Xylariales sp. PMI_506]|nr:fungal-specific transcription factor domain-containing protein [Xylariales sp. PMI_506]